MKPLTADNNDGRVLLALRAGAMTTGEFAERGLSVSGWLVREGLIDLVDGGYRITEAGRSACPLRNPLAAKAAPAIYSPEVSTMPKGETRVTRDQVLDAIKQAGAAGINRKQLIERFGCSESNMDNHIMHLAKMHAIFRPKTGHCVAAGLVYEGGSEPETKLAPRLANREAVKAFLQGTEAMSAQAIADGINASLKTTEAVLRGLWGSLQVEREKVEGSAFYFLPESAPIQPTAEFDPAKPAPAEEVALESTLATPAEPEELEPEQIEVTAVGDRRGPVVITDAEDLDIGMFSSGRLEISVGRDTVVIEPAAMKKLRGFLGLFQEAA
jgi:hypothetical protein